MTVERRRSRERRTGVIDAARRWKAGAGTRHTQATDIASALVRRDKVGYPTCGKPGAEGTDMALKNAGSYVSTRKMFKIAALVTTKAQLLLG